MGRTGRLAVKMIALQLTKAAACALAWVVVLGAVALIWHARSIALFVLGCVLAGGYGVLVWYMLAK